MVYTHNRIFLSHKESEIMPLSVTWMDLDVILSEVSQTKVNNHMISLICGLVKSTK